MEPWPTGPSSGLRGLSALARGKTQLAQKNPRQLYAMERLEPAWLLSKAGGGGDAGGEGAYSPTTDVPSVQGRIQSSDGGACEGRNKNRGNGAGLTLIEKMIIRDFDMNWLLTGCRFSLISRQTGVHCLQTPKQDQQKSKNSSGGPPPPPTLCPWSGPPRCSYLLTCCRCAVLGSWFRPGDGAADKKSGNIQN